MFYRTAFGFRLVAYRGPRDRSFATGRATCCEQDKVRFVLTTPLGRRVRSRHISPSTAMACAISRCGSTMRGGLSRWPSRVGPSAVQEPTVLRDDDGEVVIAAIQTYGDTIHSLVERRNYRGAFMPGFVRAESRCEPAAGRAQVRRSLRRQRRAGRDESLGRVLRASAGFLQPDLVRRQGHLHGIFGAHVQSRVQRQRADQVPAQRAGGGEEEIADRRIPRVLRRPRRPAHRDRDRRHREDGDASCATAASSSCACR